jgi:REP element-mobilizing transposase RayT
MPVKPNFNPHYLYFVTTTAVRRIHLFRRDAIKRIIVDSLHHLRTNRHLKLFVFVIMPNHVHIIVHLSEGYPLSDVMRDFKKFTARQIYRQFDAEGNNQVLEVLKQEGERVKQDYKVWEDSYDSRFLIRLNSIGDEISRLYFNTSVILPDERPRQQQQQQ